MNDSLTKIPSLSWTPAIGQLIDLAIAEDLGRGDVTSEVLNESLEATGQILCREPIVVCGLPLVPWILSRSAAPLSLERRMEEGSDAATGTVLARLTGPAPILLGLERTLLNFLMRLSGVATLTRTYVRAVAGTQTEIVDTRKTLPGWRPLDKYAVRIGGGKNHRHDLGSGILIKDNHIAACGSVGEAVRRARKRAPHLLRVEIEVETLPQVKEALAEGAEILLLDNMDPEGVRQVVELVGGQALLEVSGGVTLKTVRAFAEAGADLISVGALTHSATAVDLSLELEQLLVERAP